MRIASTALVAALALVLATLAATPAAAVLVHPAGAKTALKTKLVPTGNATVQWTFNATWLAPYPIYDVRRSAVEPDTVLVFAPKRDRLGNTSAAYLFALNATTGKQLWLTQFSTNPPASCLQIVETPTTVACLGTVNYGIAARHTGAVVASGQYAAGFQIGGSTFNGEGVYNATLGNTMALALIKVGPAAWTVGQVVAIDVVTGALTPMGAVTAPNSQQIQQSWGSSLRQTSTNGALEWTVVYWTQNYTQPAASCNGVFTATFSTTGNATIVAQLPASLINATGQQFCPEAQITAYPDQDVVFGAAVNPGNVFQAYHLNGTFRFAVQLPTDAYDTPTLVRPAPGFGTNGTAADSIIVRTPCQLTSVSTANVTNWLYKNCNVLYQASVVSFNGDSIIARGTSHALYSRVLNVSASSGVLQWAAQLPGSGACGDYGRTQLTATSADAFMCFSRITVVRKFDGVLAAALDTTSLWEDSAFSMNFHETAGTASAGAGQLLVGGTYGTVMSVAIAPQP